MTLSISFFLPITGSSFCSWAALVRLRPNWSKMAEPDFCPCGEEEPPTPTVSPALGLPALVARKQLDYVVAHSL